MKVFHFLTTLEWCQTANPSLYRIERKGKQRRGDVRHRTQCVVRHFPANRFCYKQVEPAHHLRQFLPAPH